MAEKITLDAKPTRSSYYDTKLVNLLPDQGRVDVDAADTVLSGSFPLFRTNYWGFNGENWHFSN